MLPNFLKPNYKANFLRLGSKFDGGYVTELNSFKNCDLLISFGLSDNWDFEKSFIKSDKKIIAVDDRLDFFFLFKKFIKSFFLNINLTLYYLYKIFDFYKISLRKSVCIEKNKVSNFISNNSTSLPALFEKYNIISKKIFLKIDIEGFEYRVFDDIINYQHHFLGLIIELHDIDLHYDKIKLFINKLNLKLVYIHPNNSGYINKDNNPTVVELTFSKYFYKKKNYQFKPNKIFDSANNPKLEDIELRFFE